MRCPLECDQVGREVSYVDSGMSNLVPKRLCRRERSTPDLPVLKLEMVGARGGQSWDSLLVSYGQIFGTTISNLCKNTTNKERLH